MLLSRLFPLNTWRRSAERSGPGSVTAMILFVTAAAVIPLTAGCGKKPRAQTPAPREVRAGTATASLETVPVVVTATGSVEAAARATVSTRMMGWVRQVHVREGQTVRAGAPLITIDDTDIRAKRAQVEAGIEEARAVVENVERQAARFEKLYAEKAVSKQQLDDVLTGRDRAKAGLASALAAREEVATHLRYLDITSPIAGLVVRKTVEPGDMAAPGAPLVTVEKIDRMKIVARVSEKDVSAVTVGDSVTVDVTSLPGAVYRAAVAKVVPAADRGSRTFDIEAFVPNPDGRLKSGMFARVLVPVGQRQAVLVPEESVIERGQLRGVFTLDADGITHLSWIRLGRAGGGRWEVLAGLTGGETVVVSPSQPLVEGDRVVR